MAIHYTDSSKNTDGKTIQGKRIIFTLLFVVGAVYKAISRISDSAVQSWSKSGNRSMVSIKSTIISDCKRLTVFFLLKPSGTISRFSVYEWKIKEKKWVDAWPLGAEFPLLSRNSWNDVSAASNFLFSVKKYSYNGPRILNAYICLIKPCNYKFSHRGQ